MKTYMTRIINMLKELPAQSHITNAKKLCLSGTLNIGEYFQEESCGNFMTPQMV